MGVKVVVAKASTENSAPATPKGECPYSRAAREISQSDHMEATPSALLSRILKLEQKVFGTKNPAVKKAEKQIAKIEAAKVPVVDEDEATE